MGTTADKLQAVLNSKNAIKENELLMEELEYCSKCKYCN